MNDPTDSARFTRLFRDVYLRLHRRVRPDAYQPSREAHAILRHLRRSGPLTVTEAAKHFTRSQAAMSEIVNRLEARELIERMPDERDRRRTLVWLSEKGIQTLEEAESVFSVRLVQHAFDQLEPKDRKQLLESLEALLRTEPAQEGWDE